MMKAMQLARLCFAFVLFTSFDALTVHPLKMSFSKLVISSDGVVDLQSRIFLDDITAQIQESFDMDSVDFSSVESEGTKALQRYLKDHFYFEQNGKKSELKINAVSFSKNKLAVALVMTTDQPLDRTKELFLTNTLLCEADPKQKNDIIYLEQRIRLSSSNPTEKIEFN